MFLKIALTLILTTIIIVSGRSLSTGKSILFQTVFIVVVVQKPKVFHSHFKYFQAGLHVNMKDQSMTNSMFSIRAIKDVLGVFALSVRFIAINRSAMKVQLNGILNMLP